MRLGTESGHKVPLDDDPGTSKDGDSPRRQLVEGNVTLHNLRGTPKDKSARHVRHDDCCGYCERYCADKISRLKRCEIEEWRQDVGDHTMTERSKTAACHRRARPRAATIMARHREFTYTAPTSSLDTEEPGFQRIRIPRDMLKDRKLLNKMPPPVKRAWRSMSRQGPDSQHPQTAPSYSGGRMVYPVDKDDHQSQASLDFSRDSLETSDSSSLCESEIVPSSQHSYRSNSNELLNVLSIDDAIRNHRDRLLRTNNVLTTADARRRKLSSVTAPRLSEDGRTVLESPDLRAETQREYRLHPRPISKFSAITLQDDYHDEDGQWEEENGTKRQARDRLGGTTSSNHQAVLKAVDSVLGAHTGTTERGTDGKVNPSRAMTAKPQSTRFRKMNKTLRNLIDREYVPDQRLGQRMNQFDPRSGTQSRSSRTMGVFYTRTSYATFRDTNTRGSSRPISHGKANHGGETSAAIEAKHHVSPNDSRNTPRGNGTFLEMLANYESESLV